MGRATLDDVSVAQMWALAGVAALTRENGHPGLVVEGDAAAKVTRFAHAVGLDAVQRGVGDPACGEPGRTVGLHRVTKVQAVEGTARQLNELLLPDSQEDETRRSLHYVLVELMRNAVQHSRDPLGGVVAAQRMDAGYHGYERTAVQVVVADAGVGVVEALSNTYPELTDPEAALVKALQPHVSGAFGAGRTGSAYNAGMGLFFISEITKLTAGRMLLATRDAALLLRGSVNGYEHKSLKFLKRGLGFPGTLVAFEFPTNEIQDHDALIEVIADKARQRTPDRDTSPWVRFEPPPQGVFCFLVRMIAEDVDGAARVSRSELQRRLFAREPVALDFRQMDVCTQSFLHALLYEAVRISWAVQVPIYIENAKPGVVTGIGLVDAYARGG